MSIFKNGTGNLNSGLRIFGILGRIIEYKRDWVEKRKRLVPGRELEEKCRDAGEVRGFADALSGDGCSLIAEIKSASPSRGIIRKDVCVADVAELYTGNGASCISVLTDERYFMGSLERIGEVRKVSPLPVLRKDFIIDPYQVYESRCAGADAVLLIAACLDDGELEELFGLVSSLGMDCLVEVHDEREMERAGKLGAGLIGINNRDLNTFETDISATGRLARYAPEDALLVSESGIFTAEHVRAVHGMGARAVLVGEAIMREEDMGRKVHELAHAL